MTDPRHTIDLHRLLAPVDVIDLETFTSKTTRNRTNTTQQKPRLTNALMVASLHILSHVDTIQLRIAIRHMKTIRKLKNVGQSKSAARGNRTHPKRFKKALLRQSARAAFAGRDRPASSFARDYSLFKDSVGYPGIEPGRSEGHLIYSQARIHNGLIARTTSERAKGIEPSLQPWQGHVRPLHHARI